MNNSPVTNSKERTAHQVERCAGLVINAPDFFKDTQFVAWLNDAVAGDSSPVMTWHKGGPVTEWSDVMVLVDPGLSGEGTDSDMPEHIWDAIVQACKDTGIPFHDRHIHVRLTNIKE